MRNCDKCNSKISYKDKFCTFCGEKQEIVNKNKNTSAIAIILIVFGCLFLYLIIMLAIIVFNFYAVAPLDSTPVENDIPIENESYTENI